MLLLKNLLKKTYGPLRPCKGVITLTVQSAQMFRPLASEPLLRPGQDEIRTRRSVLGALLIGVGNWRAIFLVNVPLAAFAVTVALAAFWTARLTAHTRLGRWGARHLGLALSLC